MADEARGQWLAELATIMKLSEATDATTSDELTSRQRIQFVDAPWNQNGWAVHIWNNEMGDIVCELAGDMGQTGRYVSMRFSLHPVYQKCVNRGGLPFHAALAELNGRGVLIAAPCNTGKSTCSRRLPAHWTALCDDEALVVRQPEGGYRVHPFPTWSCYLAQDHEKTWDVQHSVPLDAVFFLEQSTEDGTQALGQGQTAVLMSSAANGIYQAFLDREQKPPHAWPRHTIFNNACELAKRVPAFLLRATRRGRFWEKMERVLDHGV